MNKELSSMLADMRVRLEGAKKCAACGCKLAAKEAVEAGDGKLLCEGCYEKMEADAELGAMELESKDSCECESACACESVEESLAESINPYLQELRLIFTEKKSEKVSMKVGSGERFLALVQQLKDREDVDDPVALAAWIGRKKYGSKFDKLAAKGRKRAMKAKKKA